MVLGRDEVIWKAGVLQLSVCLRRTWGLTVEVLGLAWMVEMVRDSGGYEACVR